MEYKTYLEEKKEEQNILVKKKTIFMDGLEENGRREK